jgi:ATP-dependent Lhr-like helicase
LLPGLTVSELHAAIAAVEWRDPLVDANAVRGLKFSAALPRDLAIATLAARIGDGSAAQTVFSQQRSIIR